MSGSSISHAAFHKGRTHHAYKAHGDFLGFATKWHICRYITCSGGKEVYNYSLVLVNENTTFTHPAQVRNKYPNGLLIADLPVASG
jgi:hypothetical protein